MKTCRTKSLITTPKDYISFCMLKSNKKQRQCFLHNLVLDDFLQFFSLDNKQIQIKNSCFIRVSRGKVLIWYEHLFNKTKPYVTLYY